MQKKFREAGITSLGLGPTEFAKFLQEEDKKFARVVAEGNIKVE